jgi:hypothetical protein
MKKNNCSLALFVSGQNVQDELNQDGMCGDYLSQSQNVFTKSKHS